jgi:DNA-binding transcriptional MerR regulator
MRIKEGFKAKDICRIIEISYRQLDYWDRSKFISPSIRQAEGSGIDRIYSFTDLVCLKTAKRLMNEGLSLQKIRKSLEYLKTNLSKIENPLAELVLLSDGKDIFALTNDPQVILSTLNQGQLVWKMAVGEIARELQRDVKKLKGMERSRVKTA